jgi:ribosomal protein S18 acetylase RimI-like enzyme
LITINEGNKQMGSLILCYDDYTANIFSVYILESFRGKGFSKILMEKAIERSKELGCKLMELNTEVDNLKANKLYEGLGFTLKGIKDEFNNYVKIIS